MTGRPSVYLQELLTIANKCGVGDDLVRHCFINALPNTISPVIASQNSRPLLEVGTLADELIPLLKKDAFQVSHSDNSQTSKPLQSNNSRPIGLTPFHPSQRPVVCRGHLFYGQKSRSCKPWCTWPNKQRCTISRSRSASPARNSTNTNNNNTSSEN